MAERCECPDWKPGCKELDGHILMSHIHGGADWKFKVFAYCPWCGSKLKEITT